MNDEPAVVLTGAGKRFSFRHDARKKKEQEEFFWAVQDVTLQIPKGKILGILGRNGAGKTTLLHLMAGALPATEGTVQRYGRAIGLFNLGVGFQEDLTGRENIFLNGTLLGATRNELEAKQQAIIAFSELGKFIDMPMGTYSLGMRLRLAFGIVSQLDFDVLLLDEILAVGDVLFQSKCYETLIQFKESGKTLVMTGQNLDLMERLADTMILLDHGKLVFSGEPAEAIARYHALLHSEKFHVGPKTAEKPLHEKTKKWAEDPALWGKKTGTREVFIEQITLNGLSVEKQIALTFQSDLIVKVFFQSKKAIEEIHFGVAIFREDGVYCYGPNTALEGYRLSLEEGGGSFTLAFPALILCPGRYKLSVAIWDKWEALPYDYHNGYYDFEITGQGSGAIFSQPYLVEKSGIFGKRFCLMQANDDFGIRRDAPPGRLWDEGGISDKRRPGGASLRTSDSNTKIELPSVKLLDSHQIPTKRFMTGELLEMSFRFQDLLPQHKKQHLWIGLYRMDDILCQSLIAPVVKQGARIRILQCRLLPGEHKISLAIFDPLTARVLCRWDRVTSFHMVFDRADHGTVLLDHEWQFSISGKVEKTAANITGAIFMPAHEPPMTALLK